MACLRTPVNGLQHQSRVDGKQKEVDKLKAKVAELETKGQDEKILIEELQRDMEQLHATNRDLQTNLDQFLDMHRRTQQCSQ